MGGRETDLSSPQVLGRVLKSAIGAVNTLLFRDCCENVGGNLKYKGYSEGTTMRDCVVSTRRRQERSHTL